MSKRVVALLPIKANSERVRGKNFREFNGKPLYYWVLESLLSIDAIDQVVINTDARAVLEGSSPCLSPRVLIRDRAAEICGDHVNMNLVIENDINHVSADIYVMTHVTNPLLSSTTIVDALNRFQTCGDQADSLFSVNRRHARFYDRDAAPVNHDINDLCRTQDLEPWFEENSNLYIFTAQSFNKTGSRIGKRPLMYETPYLESFEIDTDEDWSLCEILSKHKTGILNN